MATSRESGHRHLGVAAIVGGSVLLWLALLVGTIPGALERVLAVLA